MVKVTTEEQFNAKAKEIEADVIKNGSEAWVYKYNVADEIRYTITIKKKHVRKEF